MKHFLFLICLLQAALFAKEYDTFYGPIDIDEPVLIDLLESEPFQRLKDIHQYGVAYYTTHREEYTRYDHSIGVFVVLRKHGASLKEQIAGLLHDVSHTVFSHVGDWIFSREYQEEDYQDSIHEKYLEKCLGSILARYGYLPKELLPIEKLFPALEQRRPNLSADRIDYNLQGAYYQNYITKEEAIKALDDLCFMNGNWVAKDEKLMAKLAHYSLFMTQDCWSSHRNHVASRALADAILRAVEIKCLSMDEVHFSTDEIVWNRLTHCEDKLVKQLMHKVLYAEKYYCLTDEDKADEVVKSRFRGINPWILKEEKLTRLTELNPSLASEYYNLEEKMARGWAIKYQ